MGHYSLEHQSFPEHYSQQSTITGHVIVTCSVLCKKLDTFCFVHMAYHYRFFSPKKDGKEVYYLNDDLIRILAGSLGG